MDVEYTAHSLSAVISEFSTVQVWLSHSRAEYVCSKIPEACSMPLFFLTQKEVSRKRIISLREASSKQ